jgi:hypothetical protein
VKTLREGEAHIDSAEANRRSEPGRFFGTFVSTHTVTLRKHSSPPECCGLRTCRRDIERFFGKVADEQKIFPLRSPLSRLSFPFDTAFLIDHRARGEGNYRVAKKSESFTLAARIADSECNIR